MAVLQKIMDYEKTFKVIQSCKTNMQNQVAYKMCWLFFDKYKDSVYADSLFREVDAQLEKIVSGEVL